MILLYFYPGISYRTLHYQIIYTNASSTPEGTLSHHSLRSLHEDASLSSEVHLLR